MMEKIRLWTRVWLVWHIARRIMIAAWVEWGVKLDEIEIAPADGFRRFRPGDVEHWMLRMDVPRKSRTRERMKP